MKLKSTQNSSTNGKQFLSIDENGPVGAITAQDRGEYIYLHSFFVSPSERGKGIGKRLFLRVLKKYTGRVVRLGVLQDNPLAIRLYKYTGFKVISTNDFVIIMERRMP